MYLGSFLHSFFAIVYRLSMQKYSSIVSIVPDKLTYVLAISGIMLVIAIVYMHMSILFISIFSFVTILFMK